MGMGARERAEEDIQAGDFASARSRLISLHNSGGYDAALCTEIAQVCEVMKDPVEAGRWYLISDAHDKLAGEVFIDRFLASCGYDKDLAFARLPSAFKRVDVENRPRIVRERMDKIGIEQGEFKRRAELESSSGSFMTYVGCFAVMGGLLIVFAVGVGAILGFLFDLID